MKKILLTFIILLFFLSTQSFAQADYAVDKGSFIIGGSASFSSFGGDIRGDDRVSIISINPLLGYFVIPNLAIGGTFSYTSYSWDDESNSSFGLGPSVAYFIGDQNSKTYPFIGGSFIYTSDDDDYTKTDFRFTGGAAFMIAKNVAVTGSVYYMMESLKYEGAEESISGNTFGIELGITAFVF